MIALSGTVVRKDATLYAPLIKLIDHFPSFLGKDEGLTMLPFRFLASLLIFIINDHDKKDYKTSLSQEQKPQFTCTQETDRHPSARLLGIDKIVP